MSTHCTYSSVVDNSALWIKKHSYLISILNPMMSNLLYLMDNILRAAFIMVWSLTIGLCKLKKAQLPNFNIQSTDIYFTLGQKSVLRSVWSKTALICSNVGCFYHVYFQQKISSDSSCGMSQKYYNFSYEGVPPTWLRIK